MKDALRMSALLPPMFAVLGAATDGGVTTIAVASPFARAAAVRLQSRRDGERLAR